MAQSMIGTIRTQSQWFRSGYTHGASGKGMPKDATEQAVVSVFQRVLSIYQDDGEVSEEQLRYEAGLLAGYLLSTMKKSLPE